MKHSKLPYKAEAILREGLAQIEFYASQRRPVAAPKGMRDFCRDVQLHLIDRQYALPERIDLAKASRLPPRYITGWNWAFDRFQPYLALSKKA